ncbi:cytochrome P450 [Sphaerisporangium rufum]|uniref:Cytochrome P450 n=1 Tax=Sphaerisporangium rufum TaxID=1381558 RepID=A0A919R0X0_9ACTN|nr:cytochrome P450 [Sphaerisporangium rufum]GII77627.1 cytochrome P450 [Sphaerisporangium rufum]
MSESTAPTSLSNARRAGRPFDPPDELAKLRAEQPISPMTYPDGHEGWLVTGHSLVRAVLADPRFSHRPDLQHLPLETARVTAAQPAPPGAFNAMDPPEHTRYRRLLTGQFTVHRMRMLTGRIEEITAEHLDAMARQGPPADLVTAFALPIPGLVICELLGVPASERDPFQRDMSTLLSMDTTAEQKMAAYAAVQAFMAGQIRAKRAAPGDDLLSGLATGTDLTDEELTNLGGVLMGAGFETTANMIALGAYALLDRPDLLAELRADPGLADQAVEELLRYLSIIPGTVRAALEDVEIGGQLIKAGQSVTVSIPAANRDPAHFPDPDTLDLHRSTAGHLAFGHGIHQCLGQQLARVEMRVSIPALLARFPTLRLAVPPEEIPLRTDMLIYGVHRLPVTWDA